MPGVRALRAASLLAALAALDCMHVSLDIPLTYAEVPPAERIRVPCYYTIEPATDAIEVSDLGYSAKLGPALAAQLQAALGGLCRGTGRVRDRGDFASVAGADPAILFQVSASAEMSASAWTWGVNTGHLSGRALANGPGDGVPRTYVFTASGQKRQYYAEAGSGAEGLRHALGEAVQNLVDQARTDRAALEELARGEPRPR